MASNTISNGVQQGSAIFDSINGKSDVNANKTSADEMQTRFLNLLITQLKNQDPLNPTDANQMTAQLSQISTVSGIEKLNASMEKLLGSYSGTQNMQAAAMIGKTVLTAGNNLDLVAGNAVGGINLESQADKVTVSIRDAAGKLVQTQNLGAQPAGVLNFVWDGNSDAGAALASGKYTFTVEAAMGDNKLEVSPLQAGMVNAVTFGKDGLSMQLANNKSVSYQEILQIVK
jgi:flagellar basal-body rod modification protein FlgD